MFVKVIKGCLKFTNDIKVINNYELDNIFCLRNYCFPLSFLRPPPPCPLLP